MCRKIDLDGLGRCDPKQINKYSFANIRYLFEYCVEVLQLAPERLKFLDEASFQSPMGETPKALSAHPLDTENFTTSTI